MTSLHHFFDRILSIKGVEGCLLTRADGAMIGYRDLDPEPYLAAVKDSRQWFESLRDLLDAGAPRHLRFSLNEQGELYLLYLEKYLLCIKALPDKEGRIPAEVSRIVQHKDERKGSR